MRISIIFLTTAILGLVACSPVQTITVVRHGEKAADGISLSDAGKQRALTLKNILTSQKIESIYSTNTARTIGTAQPTADIKKLPVTIYKNNEELIKILANNSVKGNFLIVGHSNTVPDLLRRCGCDYKKKDLDDNEFDKLFVIKLNGKTCKLKEKIY